MTNLFVLLFLLSVIGLIVGLTKPGLFRRLIKKEISRKKIAMLFGGVIVLFFVLIGITGPTPEKKTQIDLNINESANQNQEEFNSVQINAPSEQIGNVNNASDDNKTIKVIRIIDGDTVELEGGDRVRYIGMDTPELSSNDCFSREATNKNKELVENKEVKLEKDVSEKDRYGRLLAYVYVGDTFVNLELVRQGFAKAYTYPPDVKYSSQFVEAEKYARDNKLGLWGDACTGTETNNNSTISDSTAGINVNNNVVAPVQPSGSCLIKGNITTEKIYHLPGCASYDKTVIDESKGERWFCTETEAIAAGWRKAKNCP